MKHLRSVFFGLIYLLPAVLFCSYYPLITLGNDATMNFELSLPLIWLVIFFFVSLILLFQLARQSKRPLPGISDRRFFLFTLFPFYATLSAFWSPNPTRAILTAGVLWLTFFAAFAILYLLPLLSPARTFKPTILKSIFISTSVVCLICWLQCLVDVFGVPRETSLLCPGCTYQTFGFPHPSGFAIEPQFMGNLLLAPALLSIYLLMVREGGSAATNNRPSKRPSATNGERDERRLACNDRPSQVCRVKGNCSLLALACLFSSTLFLTLSRGAIYAYGVALALLLIFALIRQKSQKWSYIITIPVFTFIFTLVAQGIFAAVSPTNDTFASGTAKVVHQLSLGIVDLRPQQPETISQSSVSSDGSVADPQSTASEPVENSAEFNNTPASTNSSKFDGYIPASTNVRLGLNSLALRVWSSSPAHILFGAGLGGAGLAITAAYPDEELALPNAIIQNEPLSLLLELGLVGIFLVIFLFAVAFFPQIFPRKFLDGRAATARELSPSFWQHPALPLLVSLIAAYLVTLNFFSGLPNALQIYLMPPLLYMVFSPRSPQEPKKSRQKP